MSHRTCALVLAIAGATAAGQTAAPAERDANMNAFEKVWTTVRDKHWDPKLGGLDWQAVHDELRPKMEAAKTADEVREILNDMVERLKQTHFGIFPGSVYHDLDAASDDQEKGSVEATPGIDLRVLEGHAIVRMSMTDLRRRPKASNAAGRSCASERPKSPRWCRESRNNSRTRPCSISG